MPDADRAAFVEHAMRRYGDAVYRFALHQLHAPSEAEETAQDVFVALFASGSCLQDERHLRRWLMKAASCRCKNRWRARSRRPEDAADPQTLERAGGSRRPRRARWAVRRRRRWRGRERAVAARRRAAAGPAGGRLPVLYRR